MIETIQPLLSNHFNLTVEIPLKAIVRGHSFAVIPISWRNRTSGQSKLAIQEMGSRYLFIVLYVFLEHHLSRGDYRRDGAQDWQRTSVPPSSRLPGLRGAVDRERELHRLPLGQRAELDRERPGRVAAQPQLRARALGADDDALARCDGSDLAGGSRRAATARRAGRLRPEPQSVGGHLVGRDPRRASGASASSSTE